MQHSWKVTHVTLWSACVQIGSFEVVINITPRLFSRFRSSDRHQVLGSRRSSNGSSAMVAIVSSSSKDQHIRIVINKLIHLQNTGLQVTLYTSAALAFYVLFLLLNLYLLETSRCKSCAYKQQSMPSAVQIQAAVHTTPRGLWHCKYCSPLDCRQHSPTTLNLSSHPSRTVLGSNLCSSRPEPTGFLHTLTVICTHSSACKKDETIRPCA